jgi:isopenicillin-N epimerase
MPDNAAASLKKLFLLDPDVIFLNHGSFGATPRPVLEAQRAWQDQLERQPVRFLGRDLMDHLRAAREALGEYLNAPADALVFVPNATSGVNIVARSLDLQPGDEILTTDHEYGACINTWRFVCHKTDAHLIQRPVACPIESEEAILEQVWQGVTDRTRLIFLSHITSSTALRLPVEALCQRARGRGILSLIDGAHTPGHIDLDLEKVGADFYTGNCHKWLCAPKGSGFLYTRSEHQPLIEPLVISWGWGEDNPYHNGSRYLDTLQWGGTHDPSAYLSVPAAIEFQKEYAWAEVRQRCRDSVTQAVSRISAITGLPPLVEPVSAFNEQMASLPIPPVPDLMAFQMQLYEKHRIEIPTIEWGGRQFVRLSVQGYNDQADIDALVRALEIVSG